MKGLGNGTKLRAVCLCSYVARCAEALAGVVLVPVVICPPLKGTSLQSCARTHQPDSLEMRRRMDTAFT